MKNKNYSAFPQAAFDGAGNLTTIADSEFTGLTKREYFAGLAMQGLIASPNFKDAKNGMSVPKQITISAIVFADELLKQLESK